MRARRTGADAADADLYAVLGVERSATVRGITSAFRARVRELRPDTRVDAATAARFVELRVAYETLRDPVRRAAHDRTHERERRRTHGEGQRRTPQSAHDPGTGSARRAAPGRRYPGPVRWDPPLRAGPVRWEPPSR
ncbi:J domain-containing protein [Streptomyces sp. NPDC053367]|uniref:J domain-containing protein n=1 Tax=Streptomyces sp. NPDC053367 TaxID=3365700 RepID=UPI0037D10811